MGIAAAIAGAGALSAGSSLLGSSQASRAAKSAAGVQASQYATTRGDLLPYNTAGQAALPQLSALASQQPTGYIDRAAAANPPSVLNAQNLQNMPGYSFMQQEGLKATQSAAAARGLGVSGSSLKGAGAFATGLAQSNYQSAFNNAQTVFQNFLNLNTAQQGALSNAFQRQLNVASLGESAGAQTGTLGAQAAATQGNYLNQAGLATAAGTTGVANAATNAVNSTIANNFLQAYIGSQGGGTGGYGQVGQNQPAFG